MNSLIAAVTIFFIATGSEAAPVEPLTEFFKDKTKIENPFDLRDPFKSPKVKAESSAQQPGSVTGKYTNIKDSPIASLQVYEIKVIGVLIGKERRALIKSNAQGAEKASVIILKEGMKIGPDNAELKAILPGGIVLVEKIINVYGVEEYLETVIPISR